MRFSEVSRKWLRGLSALAVVLGVVGVAGADISEIVFQVEAASAAGTGVYQVSAGEGVWDGDTFTWGLSEPVDIMDGATVIATLNEGSLAVISDPQINLSFAVQAGAVETSFTIQSALLSFDPLDSAEGRASAAFSVTDFLGGGATLTGIGPTGGAYLAQYNGFVPGGTTFAEEIDQIVAPEFGTMTADVTVPESGYAAIAETVSNMSSQVSFTLTSYDLASGTTNFEIIPEPSGLALLAVSLGLLRRRL